MGDNDQAGVGGDKPEEDPSPKTPVKLKTEPMFTGQHLLVAGLVAVAVVLVVAVWVIVASNVFDPMLKYPVTDADTGKVRSVIESRFAFGIASFSVVATWVLGSLLLVAGFVVALSEVTKDEVATEIDGEEARFLGVSPATGVAAVGAVIAKVIESLGSAMKGLKPSAMLILVGAAIVISGTLVAWNTIPGTDKNPTITITEPTPTDSSSVPGGTTGEQSTTETTAPSDSLVPDSTDTVGPTTTG